MKKSLTIKMFVLTFLSFMILITSIFIFNSLYFTKVYEQKKITSIIDNMNLFADQLNRYNWDEYEIYRQTDIFFAKNNVQISVINSNEKYMFFPYYSFQTLDSGYEAGTYIDDQNENETRFLITVRDSNSKHYDLYISKEDYNIIFQDRELFKGDKLVINGYVAEDNIINAYNIDGVNLSLDESEKTSTKYNNEVYLVKLDNLSFITDGFMTENSIDEIGTIGLQNTTDIQVNDPQLIVKVKNGVEYSVEDTPYASSKQITFVKSAINHEGKEVALIAYASLQPVNEAVNVINEYYVYFYILAAIISIIIAVIYSRYVTKPLVRLSHSASRIADMDFHNNYEVESEDELGLLSRSLNTMSLNLENSLTELKAANKQLKLDYENEIKQEKSRKEFVANVSHELKTPLGIIRGFAEGIKDGIKKEKRDYYIDVILDEVEKMNELIIEMLELSKLEAGAIKLEEEKINLHHLVSRSASIFEFPLVEKNLKINISGFFRNIMADKNKIEQVLINLVGNAIKHSLPDTEIAIYGEISDNKNYVYISNKCAEINDEDLESIWNRFYKADKSHNRESGGTGLGLAIVKAILEAHDAEYGVRSITDGVMFYFAIKLSE